MKEESIELHAKKLQMNIRIPSEELMARAPFVDEKSFAPSNVITTAVNLLRSLAAQLPTLRYSNALRFISSYGFDKETEIEYLSFLQEGSKKEAAYVAKVADALSHFHPNDTVLQMLKDYQALTRNEMHDILNLLPDPEHIAAPLSQGVLSITTEDTIESAGTEANDCPQGHHKLEGACRFWFCKCQCERCLKQCHEGGY